MRETRNLINAIQKRINNLPGQFVANEERFKAIIEGRIPARPRKQYTFK